MTSHSDLTQRIAMSSAEAATGYATAAMAAYVDFASQVMGYWANACDTMMGKAEPRSWYRHPDSPERTRPLGFSAFAWMPMAAPSFPGQSPASANSVAPMLDPFSLWLKAWPLQGNPAAWPMAFMMMGMGVSRDVAYPLAGANAAALDAVNTAARATDENFSRYRSDSGYASAQIRMQPVKATASMMMPPGMQLFAPWFNMFSMLPRTP